MSSIKSPVFFNIPSSHNNSNPFLLKLPESPTTIMWRNVARKISPKHLVCYSKNNPSSFLDSPQFMNGVHFSSSKIKSFDPGYRKSASFSFANELMSCPCLNSSRKKLGNNGLSSRNYATLANGVYVSSSKSKSFDPEYRKSACFSMTDEQLSCHSMNNKLGLRSRNYATLAEAEMVSSTDVEDEVSSVSAADEVQEILSHMKKEQTRQYSRNWRLRNKGHVMSRRKYQALKKRQVKIETEAWIQAANDYKELLKDMCDHKLAPNLPYMKSLFLGWFEPLCNKIGEEQELCRQRKNKAAYAKYFHLLPPELMAVVTMHKLMGLLLTGGGDHGRRDHGNARVVQAAILVGEAVEQEVRIQNFLEKTKKKKVDKNEKSERDSTPANNSTYELEKARKAVDNLMKKQKLRVVQKIVKAHDATQPWGSDVKAKVGGHLIDLLLQTAYIQSPNDHSSDSPPDVRPAFTHALKNVPRDAKGAIRRYGIIKCDPLILKGLEGTASHMVIPYMPMLIPPVKWKGYDQGGHVYLPSFVMRTHGAKQQRDAVKRTPKQQLTPVFEALDTLGRTKWRINKRVLGVVERIWENGGRIGELVDREDIPLPEKPDTEDEALLKKWKWKVRNVKKENSERHSLRCDLELKLSVARKMKDEQCFFYPHNLDFRGRAYPMHPHLNHLGSDVCRGILEFAEGRPLGKSGLQWLKIHLANLFGNGVDKLSHEARLAFTENHLDDIFDSAERPLEGKRWWLNAEDPFQFLAGCINLSEALKSPSPEATISHVPVHQDGSCNGLQHYAALGRDKIGAAAVNLVAGEKPADVYSGIAARVLNNMKRDAEKDPILYPEAARAKSLINQVDRKLVKQTVMTSVYGVTYIGARDQIKRRLKERGVISEEELFGASCYSAKITLTALGEMFEAARSIMCWLGDCAKVIASENQPVRWTTPLGLPVVQPYFKIGRHLVKCSLQVLSLKRETDKVLTKRQRTAFPPNFVHSLDGSHMMMTALACRDANLTFAGVHDSYWTHACDVDELNRILREKFVELYEAPILENLLESFQTSFPTLTFPDLPERGNFDLKEVLDSPYFFN